MFSLKVNNFRGFANQQFEFRRINILIGENSGGKSSLIKFLLLLKQSMAINNQQSTLLIDGPMVDLGRYSDCVMNRKKGQNIDIDFITKKDYTKFFMSFFARRVPEDELPKHFNSTLKKYSEFIDNPVTVNYSFSEKSDGIYGTVTTFTCNTIGKLALKVENIQESQYPGLKEISADLMFTTSNGINHEIKITVKRDGFMPLVDPEGIHKYMKKNNISDKLFFEKLAYLLIAQNYFDYQLHQMSYINPIHYRPDRFYFKRDQIGVIDTPDFKTAIARLNQLSDSKIAWESFKKAMKEMGLAEDVHIEGQEDVPVIQLKAKVGGLSSNVVDVGFGVSLQIPIIMHTIIAKYQQKAQTMIIEQPEIHLHPALQAKFIEVLLKYSGDSNFIIETHSEHLLRKLQVLCKNKSVVKPNDVQIFYFKNYKGKFKISNHSITDDGLIEPAFPKGFYDNSYNLSMELL
jgi:hypothetical protein